jgi:hypothetical protein
MNVSKRQPSCILAHNLLNKLTVIIGGCDLLNEQVDEHSECSKRLATIRDVAKSMAEDLTQHQCYLDVMSRRELIVDMSKRPQHH